MKRSLHIGINDYPGTDSDLDGCVNDANDWKDALNRRGFEWQDVLLDARAFKKAMTDAIADIVLATEPGDLTVITYSGHGSWVPDQDDDELDGRDEALCPYDTDTSGVLTDDYLYSIFSCIKQGSRVVFISDSCHSGSVARRAPRDAGPLANSETLTKVKFLPPSVHLSEEGLDIAGARESLPPLGRSRSTDVLLMDGCKDTEYSYDARFDGRANGAFTYIALWALYKLDPGATYFDWFEQICRYLPSDYYPQTPQLTASAEQRSWKVFEV